MRLKRPYSMPRVAPGPVSDVYFPPNSPWTPLWGGMVFPVPQQAFLRRDCRRLCISYNIYPSTHSTGDNLCRRMISVPVVCVGGR